MLFQRADKQLQVKILDFGIAKITGKDTLNTMTLLALAKFSAVLCL